LFGPFTLADFADIGSAFNLRTKGDQSYSSEFLSDSLFRATSGLSLTDLVIAANPTLGRTLDLSTLQNALLQRDNRLVTQEEFNSALRVGPVDPVSSLPLGFSRVFVRGEGQTNTVVRLGESLFSKISDFRSSIGTELRFQVPVVNVPFRLIYAYNPNARGIVNINGTPTNFFERKSVFRFSVGRTF
jgi:outer membrane protein insertion porin family